MKSHKLKWGIACVAIISAFMVSGCTSRIYTAYSDDLYGLHDRSGIMIAEIQQKERELAAREARLAAMERGYQGQDWEFGGGGAYNTILSDTYADSYERRLRGYESGWYNMPSSYSSASAITKLHYASAYDPAYYNIVVMGDEIWVEPKYISALFGYTGVPRSNISLNFGSSWGWPYNSWYGWNNPWNNSWYGWNRWNDPWFNYGWGWNSGWGWRPNNYWWGSPGFPSSSRPSGNRFGSSTTIVGRPRTSVGAPSTSIRRAPASSGTVIGSPGVSSYGGGSPRREGATMIQGGSGSNVVRRPSGTNAAVSSVGSTTSSTVTDRRSGNTTSSSSSSMGSSATSSFRSSGSVSSSSGSFSSGSGSSSGVSSGSSSGGRR